MKDSLSTFQRRSIRLLSTHKSGGVAGLVTLASILLVEILIPSAIAGNRVSGISDISSIFAWYNHPSLVWTYWPNGFVIFFFVFIYAIYPTLRDQARASGVAVLLLAAVGIGVIAVPLLLTRTSLAWVLVGLSAQYAATTDAVTRTTLEVTGLTIFKLWDVLYNSLLYWVEGGYTLLFGIVFLRTNVFKHWIGWLSIAVAVYQFVNTLAIPAGFPDTLTLPGNLLFVTWFLSVSVSLLRLKTNLA